MRVALFDFDGTVYKKETFKVLMEQLKYHPVYGKRYKRFFLRMLPNYLAYKCKLQKEAVMKENSMRHYLATFKQEPIHEVEAFFYDVAKQLTKDLNIDVIKRMEQHQTQGYKIMLVSGAFIPLLEGFIKEAKLPIDVIIGTEIPTQNGRINRLQDLRHIQGDRKIEEIQKATKQDHVDWEDSYAYGDSYSDLPMLELVGHPVAVQPEPRLKFIAEKHQWEILE